MNTSACCWLRLTSLSAFVLFSTLEATKADELKYWVSEHFSETPNLFDTPNGKLPPDYGKLVSLEAIDWAYDSPGAIRLCFDNRSLVSTSSGRKVTQDRWGEYCKSYNIRLNYKNKGPNWREVKRITEGLIVYRSIDGVPTCESTFTIASLYSVLTSINEGKSLEDNQELLVYPYFQADGDPFHGYPAIKRYLKEGDVFEASDFSGYKINASLANSISCLLPAYQKYWRTVRDQCLESINQTNATHSFTEKYVPILELLEDDFRKIASSC